MIQSGLLRRLTLGAIVTACGLTFAPLACAPVETAITVEPGASFTLPVGKTASLRGTDSRLTFREVSQDSRCPIDVVCVWEGEAIIAVVISRNGAPGETKILNIRAPNNEVTSGDLRIRFVGLTPVPRESDKTPRAYVAQFVVEQL